MKDNFIYIIGTAILGAIISFLLEPAKEYIQNPWVYGILISVLIVSGFRVIEKSSTFNKKFVITLVLYSILISLSFLALTLWLISKQVEIMDNHVNITTILTEKIKNLENELEQVTTGLNRK